jgi:SAM-dependent methyltransferase
MISAVPTGSIRDAGPVRRADGLPSPRAWLLGAVMTLLACSAAAQPVPATESPQVGQVSKDSVWVPTPERMIRRLLQMADTTADDVVVDLGSGDGRIPIYAARHFGARAIGVELEDNLVRLSIESARAQGVSDRARFVRQDLFEFDLSTATVIALYISPGVMTKLKPRLLGLRPGTRVASHQFTLDDWAPDETIRVEDRTGHLWVVPADVRGTWSVQRGDDVLKLTIEQTHQRLATRGARAGREVHVIGARLRGTEIGFVSFDPDGSVRHFRGRVDGRRMSGDSDGHGVPTMHWSATRD